MRNTTNCGKIWTSLSLILSIFYCGQAYGEVKWINKSAGMAGYEFTTLCPDKSNPDIIYAGTNGAVLKTTDGGGTWKNIFKVPGAGNAVNFIVKDPKNPNVLYAATAAGIFKSEDNGNKWSAYSHNIREHNVLYLLVDTDNSNVIFAVTENSVYKSENGGANWVKSSDGISERNITSVAQNFLEPKILFAGTENGLFKSENSGSTWKKIFFADSADEAVDMDEEHAEEDVCGRKFSAYIAVDCINPSVLYFAAKKGTFKSEDNGASWKRLPKTGMTNAAVNNLAVSPHKSGVFFTATEKGIFRFSKEENAWREFNQGLSERKINFVAPGSGQETLWIVNKRGVFQSSGDIYEINEKTTVFDMAEIMRNFCGEPCFRETQEAAIKYAEVNPDKIAKWRKAARTKALLPTLSLGIDKNSSRGIHWDSGTNPDAWVLGPDDENTGWDITCSWNLGELIWNDDQTSIDTRSKLMVELRNDIIDEITRLYFERRRIQVELLQNPPKDLTKRVDKTLRIEELTANIDGMTGGYFSKEIELRKSR